jgi:hypothetical protein
MIPPVSETAIQTLAAGNTQHHEGTANVPFSLSDSNTGEVHQIVNNSQRNDTPADYSTYYSLTDYQRHCLITSNYHREKQGIPPIPIPLSEFELIKSGHYFTPSPQPAEDNPFGWFGNDTPLPPKPPQPKFSFFNQPITNTLPAKTITLSQCFELIKLPYPYKEVTDKLRSLSTLEERKTYKAQHLAYATFSGTFSRRTAKSLILHSGLIIIDLDHLPNPEEIKLLLHLDYDLDPALIFTSPSGDGLKVTIPVDIAAASHADYFDAISSYLLEKHNLQTDPSGRDVSRACFLCHDPHVYINPEYNDWK